MQATSVKDNTKRFIIKRIDKVLHAQKIAKSDDGSTICVSNDIVKEGMLCLNQFLFSTILIYLFYTAIMLHHLTVANKPISDAISQYIEFLDDDTSYYLVTECISKMTLSEWINKAFGYIHQKKLKVKHYRKIVKYIIWQLLVC